MFSRYDLRVRLALRRCRATRAESTSGSIPLSRADRLREAVTRGRRLRIGVMTTSNPDGPFRIFISYRHDEDGMAAGWLVERLARRFGKDQVFKDVDSIEPGDDFVKVITDAVGSCDVLLALIGRQWVTITGEDGRPRLDNP